MHGRSTPATVIIFLLSAGGAACGGAPAPEPPAPDGGPQGQSGVPVVQPGLPGEASEVLPPGTEVDASFPHTEADVRFMQGMIHHHAQALAMSALAPDQAGSEEVRRLAHRIDISQQDEIELMRNWLEARGEHAPEPDPEHTLHMEGHEDAFMPGMLTHDQMARLEAASGPEFDRLFLEYMIQHHEGALVMVQELFRNEGAAYEVEIHQFATHVEADQNIEIRRMQTMLDVFP